MTLFGIGVTDLCVECDGLWDRLNSSLIYSHNFCAMAFWSVLMPVMKQIVCNVAMAPLFKWYIDVMENLIVQMGLMKCIVII